MLTLTNQDNGRRFPAQIGQIVELHLAENATTGYRWAVDPGDQPLLQLLNTTADYPNAAPGSGGEAIFRFKITGPGQLTLSLKHWRHWEGPASIIERFVATIDATP